MFHSRTSPRDLPSGSRTGGVPARPSPRGEPPIRYPGTCTLILGSMTETLRAQKTLEASSIPSFVTKISSSQSRRGCVYGLYCACASISAAADALNRAGIRVREIIGEV